MLQVDAALLCKHSVQNSSCQFLRRVRVNFARADKHTDYALNFPVRFHQK